jgi:tripartite-type tricarboxylate transporter receptor subunit TctC
MANLAKAVSIALVAASVAGASGRASAQAYPTRPVTVVVPFAAGGGNDIMGRLLGQHMGGALGQQFVIDNRGGAAGTIGARAVAKATPDGYTLMVGHSGLFAIASYQQVLVVHPSFPARTLADLLAMAKKDPGKITYATAGIGSGSHISTELLVAMAGIKLVHVPYRGSGPAMSDLVGGHVDIAITTIPPSISHIRGGLLRAIAVTGSSRLAILPDVPTVAEAGVPGYDAVIKYGMVAPAGTPRPIVERLNSELNAALRAEDVSARIVDEGGDALPGTPEQQAADIDAEETKWGAVVRKLGLKAE